MELEAKFEKLAKEIHEKHGDVKTNVVPYMEALENEVDKIDNATTAERNESETSQPPARNCCRCSLH